MCDDQIIIHKMIVHKTDHKHLTEPQLSDMESPLSEDVSGFLRMHIKNNREHKYTRNAKFYSPPEGVLCLKDLFDKILSNQDEFISQSRSIASTLFNVIKNNKNNKTISSGDLIICTFSDASDGVKWLAVLKVDPKDGFVGERESIDGHVRITLRQVKDVLPSGGLQKCAFIAPQELRESIGYDLQVLDQQVSRFSATQLIASFFIKDFLQCKVGLNREDATKRFFYASQNWVNKKDWPEEDKFRFRKRVTEAIQDNIVDATSVAQAVILKPEEQDEYLVHLRQKGLDELTFEPDPVVRQKLIQYATFEGDSGLRIRIEKNAIGPDKTLYCEKDEATNTWIITIKTTQWKRVLL